MVFLEISTFYITILGSIIDYLFISIIFDILSFPFLIDLSISVVKDTLELCRWKELENYERLTCSFVSCV
jgi:hypothetical protein